MTHDRELMQQALEALESSRVFVTTREKIKHPEGTDWYDERTAALRERLAQPEQGRQHDYRIRYDRGCYKCGSNYCPANCPVPAHLVRQQPVQEPVAWCSPSDIDRTDWKVWAHGKPTATMPFYTTPQRPEWVGLTDEDRYEFAAAQYGWEDLLIAAEAKLREKNGGAA